MNTRKGMRDETITVAALLDDAAVRIADRLELENREARLEARTLAAFAWEVAPSWLIAHDTDQPAMAQITHFRTLLARRLSGEPIAYLTGLREFYGRNFKVSSDVLIPRPETELLVELALARIPLDQTAAVLDLGTGSGCIALTLALERPHASITAVDRSTAALTIAKHNGGILDARVEFLTSDWFTALTGKRFDLIVANPPYIANADSHLTRGDIRFEPLSALAAGNDGLADLRHLIAEAPDYLKPGGALLLEHGYDQADVVQDLFLAAKFSHCQRWMDLAGIYRVSGGELSE